MEICGEKGNCRGKRAEFAYIDDSIKQELTQLRIQEIFGEMRSDDMDTLKELADWIKGDEVLTAAEKRLNMCERDKG